MFVGLLFLLLVLCLDPKFILGTEALGIKSLYFMRSMAKHVKNWLGQPSLVISPPIYRWIHMGSHLISALKKAHRPQDIG